MEKIINEIITGYFNEFDRDVLPRLKNIVQNGNVDLTQLQDLEIIKNSILNNENLNQKNFDYTIFLIAMKYGLIRRISMELFQKVFSELSNSEKKILNKYLGFSENIFIDSKISGYFRFLKSEDEINSNFSKNNVIKRISELIGKNTNYSYGFLEKEVKNFNFFKISVIGIGDFYFDNNFLEKYKNELEEKNKPENQEQNNENHNKDKNNNEAPIYDPDFNIDFNQKSDQDKTETGNSSNNYYNPTLNNGNSSENDENSDEDRGNSEEKSESQQESSENSSDGTNQNNSNATENKSSENQDSTTNTQGKKYKQEAINNFLIKVEKENLDKELFIDRICKTILNEEKNGYNNIREQFSIGMGKSLDEINFMIKKFKEKNNKSES